MLFSAPVRDRNFKLRRKVPVMGIDVLSNALLFAQAAEEVGQVFDRRVMLIFPAVLLVFLLPALFRRVYPTKLLFVTVFATTLLSTLLYVYDDFWFVVMTVDVAITLVLLIDGFATLPIIGQDRKSVV